MENLLNLTYTEKEDGLLYPNIDMENENQPLGRFGRNWMDYMHQNHSQRFMSLRMQGTLEETAHRVELEALARQETMYQQLLAANSSPQTEDSLEIARHLTGLHRTAQEIVMNEIVLRPR